MDDQPSLSWSAEACTPSLSTQLTTPALATGTAACHPSVRPTATRRREQYHSYHMQRLQTTANHVLFYVVDGLNHAHLAIVGTDVRLTGHFVYCNVPEFQDGPPIRCTNRGKIIDWLAALGAVEPADPSEVSVPSISQQQLDRLLTSDPMHSKPRLSREYTNWREEGGRLPDGRHFKHFYLTEPLGSPACEQLIIIAEDSQRKDRRYSYKAVPEIGGFAFENGQAVKGWLDFVVGRPPSDTVPGPKARPSAKAKGKGSKGTPAAQQSSVSHSRLVSASGQHQQCAVNSALSALPADSALFLHHPPGIMYHHQGRSQTADDFTNPEVVAALTGYPELLEWVTATPDACAVSRVEMWSHQLSHAAHHSHPLHLAALVGGSPETAEQHNQLMQIIQQLRMERMSLRLLDRTQVALVVHQLCFHTDQEVAAAAANLLQDWQTTASAVLGQATTALQQGSAGQSVSEAPAGSQLYDMHLAELCSCSSPMLH